MRIFLALLVCVFPLMSFGQGLKLTSMTTNLTMNQPVSGGSPIWNATANRWSNGVVVAAATNAIGNSLGLGTNTSLFGSVTNNGTLRQVGASELLGPVRATNSNIQIMNDGFWMVFGPPLTDGFSTLTNNAVTYQNGQWIMNVAGQSIEVSGGAFQSIKTGSTIRFESGAVLDMDNLPTNAVLRVGSGGIISTQTLGSGLSMSAAGVLSATGSGDVTKVGTPVNNQVGVWTGDGTIEGTTAMTFDNTTLELLAANPVFKLTRTGTSETNTFFSDGLIVSDSVWYLQVGTADATSTTFYFYDNVFYSPVAIHTPGASVAGSLSVSNALGPPSLIRLSDTNNTFTHTIQAATRMSRSSTNIPGVFEAAAASVLELNTRQQHKLYVTNRMAASSTLVVTNSVPGEEYTVVLMGAVAGGTDYTCTYVPHTGQLARNLDGTNNAPATSISISVPAGSTVEINSATRFGVGTNWHDVVTRKGLGS